MVFPNEGGVVAVVAQGGCKVGFAVEDGASIEVAQIGVVVAAGKECYT